LTKSSWVLCPVHAVEKLFFTNHSSAENCFPRITAQNLLLVINQLIN